MPGQDDWKSYAEAALHRGLELRRSGSPVEALAAFAAGIAAVPAEADGSQIRSDLHFHAGRTALDANVLDAAGAHYLEVVRLTPGRSAAWCDLGNLYMRLDRPADAFRFYSQAVICDGGNHLAHIRRAIALVRLERVQVARALLAELPADALADPALACEIGRLLAMLGDADAARPHLERALADNPDDTDALYWLASVEQNADNLAAAEAAYVRALARAPFIRKPAAISPPAFTVLALYAPFAGNTPTEFMFEAAPYEVRTVALVPSAAYDAASLGEGCNLLVNLVSDADQGATILPTAQALADTLGLPVINHPLRIDRTTRERTADVLAGLADARLPRAARFAAGTPADVILAAAETAFRWPLLARPAGTHGGDDFDKLSMPEELAAFVARHGSNDIYLIEFADYRSDDGHYRKYRFIFVEDAIFPYHLAIGDDWKVHHVRTEMDRTPWMQEEEAAFLARPGNVFEPRHFSALAGIRARFGLDYFGIDCGLDRDGNLLVFEVNASMLVHQKNETMPYKVPHVAAIKTAFDAMLARRVTAAGPHD
ncbi:MAG: tetratricopeptide repeat protein [Ancalomicrobiaceae bacterium]|nr:tetratricopeptide repeat protein [Ancalomicrobiaceae bacterium]